MSATSAVDVVIVGAGAAGLAAGRTAQSLGLSFVVFEAMSRIGGRAFTNSEPFGVPWDLGRHWLHSADVNPMRALADEYGFRYRRTAVEWRLHLGDRWATDSERDAARSFVDEALAAVRAAGEDGRDQPVSEVVDRSPSWWMPFESVIHAEWGVEPAQVSTLDYGRYRDTGNNWPVEDGYGALVARHAAGVPVTRSTPVEWIDWTGSRIRVGTTNGTIEANAVIITASTAALAEGMITFIPALPVWKQEAFEAVPLGKANKVAAQLHGGLEDVAPHTAVLASIGDRAAMSFQLKPFGWNLANGYLAGPACSELERAGEAAMVDAALSALTGIFGSDIGRRVVKTACSCWEREPYIRGGYGAAWPGQANRRVDLGRPIEDRLFFAGEATSQDFFSTCHGAHLTGIATARAVAEAFNGAVVSMRHRSRLDGANA